MSREIEVWEQLTERAARQLPPDFADRVVRVSRQQAERAPSFMGQFALSAATAALCFLAVSLFEWHSAGAQDTSSLADWQQIASATDDASLAQ